jgi:HAD superfamily phosphoserine phosphatase-like hydrolase
MDAERVKKSFISSILKGETKSRIGKQAQKFFDENYPKIIRKNALDFIRNRDLEKTESLLITASLDIWTKPFAEKFGMKLLATRAEFKNEVFTGNFIGPNCNGVEKLNRIKEEVQGRKYDKTIAFGDTAGDRPMLNWAHEGHFRFFH